jgi:hypothetical protein
MRQDGSSSSILLADCGTIMTKALLIDRVAGRYRFIARGAAPTTAERPFTDVTAGIRHAFEQITEVTGRFAFDKNGNLMSPELAADEGVDLFASTASASQPLQVLLMGLVRAQSVASLERAAAGTYSLTTGVLSSDEEGHDLDPEERIQLIRDTALDVICIAGGHDGGADDAVLDLVETAALACALTEEARRPHILYAGNATLRERVARIVGGRAELTVADNTLPAPGHENLLSAQRELDALYIQNKVGALPGVDGLRRWSAGPLQPTGRSFQRTAEYLWHLAEGTRGVLAIDVGSSNTVIAAVFDGQPHLTVRADTGIAFGGTRLLRDHASDSVLRWIPEAMSSEEALGILMNKELHPASIPQEPRELHLEQAVAREAIRCALAIAAPGWYRARESTHPHLTPPLDTVILSGAVLAQAPRPGQAALILLDALEPAGITTLLLDRFGLAQSLGSLAAANPLAAVEVLDTGGLVNLATVIVPVGAARPGETVLQLKMTYDDGSTFGIDVKYGDLELLPVPPGQRAVIDLKPSRGIDVGLGGPGVSGKRRIAGSLVGLLVDARGRPLSIPEDPAVRREQMQHWRWDVGA